jgi:hypothetical protein
MRALGPERERERRGRGRSLRLDETLTLHIRITIVISSRDGLPAGQLVLEAGLVVCPPLKTNLWRRLPPKIYHFWNFWTASINPFSDVWVVPYKIICVEA